jgi:hypothetical protein
MEVRTVRGLPQVDNFILGETRRRMRVVFYLFLSMGNTHLLFTRAVVFVEQPR